MEKKINECCGLTIISLLDKWSKMALQAIKQVIKTQPGVSLS